MSQKSQTSKTKKSSSPNNLKKILTIIVALFLLGIIIFIIVIISPINKSVDYGPPKNHSGKCTVYVDGQCIPYSEKPIIYLYPESETKINIKLGHPEKLTSSYPEYPKDGWTVTAKPNGNLIDVNTNKNLYSLYWEGSNAETNFENGFIVAKNDLIPFLEEKLSILGLNERESEEFIIYWLPRLQQNNYNLIRFATAEEIDSYMPLEFSQTPDSLIRVLMQFKKAEKTTEVPGQILKTPERKGFVVVEWGGVEAE